MNIKAPTKEKMKPIAKGLANIAVSLFLFISVLSYNQNDSSTNRAVDGEIYNLLGMPGAFIADPAIQFIGLSSILLAVILFAWGTRTICKRQRYNIWAASAASLLALTLFSSFFSMIASPEWWPFYVGMGGMAGDLLIEYIPASISDYTIFSALLAIFIPAAFFALRMNIAEVVWIYKKIALILVASARMVYFISIKALNLARRVIRKEPLKIAEPPPEAEDKKDIVEYKKKPKKKKAAKQASLDLDTGEFKLPDMYILTDPSKVKQSKTDTSPKSLEQNAKLLKKVLEDFGVQGEIVKVRPGPVVTLYELEPAAGTKSSRVIGLSDDIARSMSAISVRIAVVPGRNILGIELPNITREVVYLRELFENDNYKDKRIKLPIALGKDIGGESVMTDLARMPHLLIAGTTGSGKSVAVNAMILSFLYRLSPEECKFIMIDPKMLELSVYDGIPHLISPVVTEPGKAVVALKWAVREMENRYRLMSNMGVRNITGYNKAIEDAIKAGKQLERKVQTGFDPETGEPVIEIQPLEMVKLPFIVIIVDEMADLMLTAGKEIESSIQRLAQMARAAGIHMVMATQRPSVDVITGVIKANFPTRISFQVTSRIDSRTILGEMGAEQLLGMGDMLYMAGGGRITRVHGPFVDDKEVERVVSYLKSQGAPSYIEDITKEDENNGDFSSVPASGNSEDALYDQAVAIVLRDKKVSTSYVQRQLRIGYNKAANLIERMEREGVISEAGHAGKREVLVN